jgi:hypothetical protein
MSANLIFLKTQLYALKREYGFPAAFYRVTPGTTNLETGDKAVTRIKYTIDNVVVLPMKADTMGFYAAALLKAAREFSYGGFQDQDSKFMIIDGDDLPCGFVPNQQDSIIYEHRKYEIVTLQEIEDQVGYYIVAKYLRGEPVNEVHEVSIFQSLRFVQGVIDVRQ